MMKHTYLGAIISRWFPWLQTYGAKAEMAPRFIGSRKDLEHYLSPMFQDLARQNTFNEPRSCQCCGSGNIDHARIGTADMSSVMDTALDTYYSGRTYSIDLHHLEQQILEEYKKQEKALPILCRDCMKKRQETLIRESYKFPDLSRYKGRN